MGQNVLYLAEWPQSCSHRNALLQPPRRVMTRKFSAGARGSAEVKQQQQICTKSRRSIMQANALRMLSMGDPVGLLT